MTTKRPHAPSNKRRPNPNLLLLHRHLGAKSFLEMFVTTKPKKVSVCTEKTLILLNGENNWQQDKSDELKPFLGKRSCNFRFEQNFTPAARSLWLPIVSVAACHQAISISKSAMKHSLS